MQFFIIIFILLLFSYLSNYVLNINFVKEQMPADAEISEVERERERERFFLNQRRN